MGYNDVLTSLDGLEDLVSIGGMLRLDDNEYLSDVMALHGVISVGSDFTITDNLELLTADAEALRDAIGTSNIGGTVTIGGNKWRPRPWADAAYPSRDTSCP